MVLDDELGRLGYFHAGRGKLHIITASSSKHTFLPPVNGSSEGGAKVDGVVFGFVDILVVEHQQLLVRVQKGRWWDIDKHTSILPYP